MGEVSSVVDLLGALMRLLGLEENALFPAIALLILFFLFAIPIGLLAQSRKVRTGSEGIVGETGRAVTDIRPEGRVFVHSEYWNAVSGEPVTAGEAVRVVGLTGMVLRVERVKREV